MSDEQRETSGAGTPSEAQKETGNSEQFSKSAEPSRDFLEHVAQLIIARPLMAAEVAAATRAMSLFAGERANAYWPETTRPGDNAGKVAVTATSWCGKPTVELWALQLRGSIGLGVLPPGPNGRVMFGVIDVDDYSAEMLKIIERIELAKLSLVPVGTKSGGLHLILFVTAPVEQEVMKRVLTRYAAQLGLKLKGSGGENELIVTTNAWMPHCGVARVGVRAKGGELTLEEFLRAAEKNRVSPEDLIAAAAAPPPRGRRAAQPVDAATGTARAARRLAHFCDTLAPMQDNEGRDNLVNKACWEMGRYIDAGWLEREVFESALAEAAVACGYDLKKLAEKLRRVVKKGIAAGPPDVGEATSLWRDFKPNGKPAPSLANAVIAIKALGIGCRQDLFHHVILVEYRGDVAEIKNLVGELTDDTIGAIRSLINNHFRLDVGDANALAAVKEIARDHAFDPVVDYLAEVQGRWDGKKRIGTWLTDYCGAPDTPFTRAVGRLHLMASVRRARQPGCKYDYILVMESPEGQNKSTAIEGLGGKENFSDQTILGVDDKMAQELMTGVWLYEVADLTGVSKADVNKVKAFASRNTDRARPAYGRCVEKRPRRCTLWGTTNDKRYLTSQTGNRRFFPVKVGRIDIKALTDDRDQLWAEAAVAEAVGGSIALDESLWATAAEEQEKRRTIDPWEDTLANMPNVVEVKPARASKVPNTRRSSTASGTRNVSLPPTC